MVADLTPSNVEDLLGGVDLILDGTDNFETRYLINDFAVERGVPWVYGAAVGSYGIAMPVIPGQTACLRCIYPDPPAGAQPTCETAGVLGSVTALIASLQVSEAIKILCGVEPSRKITTVDVWSGEIRQVAQPGPVADCPACGRREFPYLTGERRAPVSLCGHNAVQIHERARPLELRDLAARLAPLGPVRANEFALRFEAPPYLLTIFPDGRAIIKGTTDVGVARSLYARYIGALRGTPCGELCRLLLVASCWRFPCSHKGAADMAGAAEACAAAVRWAATVAFRRRWIPRAAADFAAAVGFRGGGFRGGFRGIGGFRGFRGLRRLLLSGLLRLLQSVLVGHRMGLRRLWLWLSGYAYRITITTTADTVPTARRIRVRRY